ncbi:MAG: hypothetical protein K2N64_02050 [Anaeroplasmataceae bacterium]|nr:hypothetical protein [Anaeroplasmataceae bacterium]
MKEIEFEYLKRYLKDGEENVLEFSSGYMWLTYNLSPAFNYVFCNPTFETVFSVFKKLPLFQSNNPIFEFYIVYYREIKQRFRSKEIKRFFGEKINMSLIELCEILLKEKNINYSNDVYEFYTYSRNGRKEVCFSKAYKTRQELYNELINYKG